MAPGSRPAGRASRTRTGGVHSGHRVRAAPSRSHVQSTHWRHHGIPSGGFVRDEGGRSSVGASGRLGRRVLTGLRLGLASGRHVVFGSAVAALFFAVDGAMSAVGSGLGAAVSVRSLAVSLPSALLLGVAAMVWHAGRAQRRERSRLAGRGAGALAGLSVGVSSLVVGSAPAAASASAAALAAIGCPFCAGSAAASGGIATGAISLLSSAGIVSSTTAAALGQHVHALMPWMGVGSVVASASTAVIVCLQVGASMIS